MKVTIEIDDYLASQIRGDSISRNSRALDELVRLIDKAQREAIVAKASGAKPGAGPVQPAEEKNP